MLVIDAGPAEATFPGQNGKIAYESYPDGYNEIYTIDPDGSGKVQVTNDNLTHDTVTANNPSWGSRP